MTEKINYQNKMEEIIKVNHSGGKTPSLLLHCCCGPCSSYVLDYLSEFFSITVLYYNPNIYPEKEYYFREEEQEKLIAKMEVKNHISFMRARFDPQEYYRAIKGHEKDREGGERCHICYELRLMETARIAKEEGFDFFTTTLSISPHKNSQVLNKLGGKVGEEVGVAYLYSDFKKKNGFKKSVDLTCKYDMYRQDYCGCVFSLNEAKERINNDK